MKQVFSLDEYKWSVDHETRTLTVTKREETAQQWVKRLYQACCEDKSRAGVANSAGRYTVLVDDKGNIGKSICHPLDKWDRATGIAIAYARLRHIPIHPDFLPKGKKVEKVKEIIKNNIEDALWGIFDCRNTVGDPNETIYDEGGVRIDICRGWAYFEVFGLTNEEFAEVESFYKDLVSEV